MEQKLIIIFILFSHYLYNEILSFSNANLESYLQTILFPKFKKRKNRSIRRWNNLERNAHYRKWWTNETVLWKIFEWRKDTCSTGDRKSLFCKTTPCIVKTSSNKINRKERTRLKVYSKLATNFLINVDVKSFPNQ